MIPDYQNTLTHQSSNKNDSPRDLLHSPVIASWWKIAPQVCIPWVSGRLPLFGGIGGKMQWKIHELGLQTPWAVPLSFPWSWGDLQWAWTAYWCLQVNLGMRLIFNRGVHWWKIFCPRPEMLLPTVAAPSGQCGMLCMDLMRCTSSFLWSWGEWQIVWRGDRHSTRCCAPGFWWSVLE